VWSNWCATAFAVKTLPAFKPSLIAHYVSERAIGTKAVDIVKDTGAVINIRIAR
jgi:hypothetical protein